MTQSQLAYQAQAGDFLRYYKPTTNINTIINDLLGQDVSAFPSHPSAFITTLVQFPDVSFYQKEIDYEIMRTKTRAIILRAGQGTYPDIQFERNYAEAKRTGLLVGVYWFYDDRVDPREQAETLLRVLMGKKIDMEVFIDWENTYGGQFKGLQNVVSMMQLVEGLGYRVGIYTGYYWFRGNSNSIANASQYNYLKNRPLWLGWYTNNPDNVLIPAPWSTLVHWQWGTPTLAWGQKTQEIDMNFFNGTEQEFIFRYGVVILPPGGNMSYKITPDMSIGSKIRSDHVTGVSNQIGTLSYGRYAYGANIWGDGTTEKWLEITEYENNQGSRVALHGWIAERSSGTKVATISDVVDVPPPPPVEKTITEISIINPESVTIKYSDGTSETK